MKLNTITLINLGGPRNKEEIEGFLRDLFLDKYVFDLPLWEPLRQILAKFIAKKRATKVAVKYASMGYGGGSPLYAETERQALALRSLLKSETKESWEFRVVMTCGQPNIRNLTLKDLQPSKSQVFLPLFPQFSRSTTLSTGMIMKDLTGECSLGKIGWVDQFGRDPRFHEVTSQLICDYFRGHLNPNDFIHLDSKGAISNWEDLDIVFSAHGIPMRLVNKGDSYVEEVEASVLGITNCLRENGFRGEVHISYQSRVGPAKWTEPNTIQKLEELGRKSKRIAIYPISFVGDHLETLEEIGEELREVAMDSGINEYYRIPALGIYPKFIEYLKDLVLESRSKPINKIKCLCKTLGGEKPSCLEQYIPFLND